ncbi:NADH-quinone oxidoreductase subunit NuoB [bacterium]|nr:NADH-quinone oxidoreductase subunit NuoB [bacterium]
MPFRILTDPLRSGRVTEPLPEGKVPGGVRFELARSEPDAVARAITVCPADAIRPVRDSQGSAVVLDEGRCVFCGLCAEGENAAFRATLDEPLPVRRRKDLERRFPVSELPPIDASASEGALVAREASALGEAARRRFQRSLQIRQVDAGGCNGCEWEIAQLLASQYDIQRFGIDFVASPRHADMLLVTGVVTRNLELALRRTLEATPEPRLVVGVGACAISGGIFKTSYASLGGVDRVTVVNVYVPGCPPRPWMILKGIRMALEETAR